MSPSASNILLLMRDQLTASALPHFQPFVDASKQFVHSGGQSSPTQVKARARFPFVSPKLPDMLREPSE